MYWLSVEEAAIKDAKKVMKKYFPDATFGLESRLD
jgi:hypothetical protein